MNMELRTLVYPDGQQRLQYRVIETWENGESITLPMTPIWSPWTDVPKVDYRAAQQFAAQSEEAPQNQANIKRPFP